jgi:hypothetical protein
MLEVTANAPFVPELRERLDDPSALVTMEAVTPIVAALIAPSNPASVLFGEAGMLITFAVPVPTVSEIEPESASLAALAIGVRTPLDVELLV